MYLTAIKYAAPAIAGAFAMWLYHSAVVSDIRADAAVERQVYAEQSQAVAVKAQKEVAKIEQYHYDKMQRAIAGLAKPSRVFVRANCPSLSSANLSGVDTGERAELDADSRQLVRELRGGILRLEEKLAACQGLLQVRDG
jgi:hypothetical protein